MVFEKYEKQISEMEKIYNQSYNIFKILKQESYENRHSNFLSWLFDKNASHGLKERFAEEFFKASIGKDCDIDCSTISLIKTEQRINGETQKEKGNDKRRIDILIVGDKFTCTIENKYGSTAHGGQCSDYREYIEGRKNTDEEPNGGKYPVEDGWRNYFIFLDINEPPDFKSNHADVYSNYSFISYKAVIDILNKLTEGKEDSIQLSYIRQYIEILEENYKPLSEALTKICKSIKDEDIIRIIDYKKDINKLPEAYQIFVKNVKKYYDQNKAINDNNTKKILTELINKDIPNIYSQKYAYALPLSNKIFKNKAQFIKTVDYTAISELCIDIHVGLKPTYSENFADHILSDSDFWEKLKNLKKNKSWECLFLYRVCTGNNYLNKGIIDDIYCDIDNYTEFSDLISKDHIVYNDKKANSEQKKKYTKKCIEGLVNAGQADSKKAENLLNEIRERNGSVTTGWCLFLRYHTGYYNFTDRNIDEIKKLYKEKTIEGLKIFGLEQADFTDYFKL